jgi:hypothetical protein
MKIPAGAADRSSSIGASDVDARNEQGEARQSDIAPRLDFRR